MTTIREIELAPSHGAAGMGKAITSMARRVASRYNDWAAEDVQLKSESLESSIHRRVLDLPADSLARKNGVARGDKEELLPMETTHI